MKRVSLTSVAIATLSLIGTAHAADLSRRGAAPAAAPASYIAPIYNWSGLYTGLTLGGGWGNSNWTDAAGTSGDFDTSGAVIGGTLGHNWQAGQFVYGIEGDINWTNIDGGTPTAFCAGCSTENNWLGTVRGRLGYAIDRIMPYVTGGVAFGDIQANAPGFPGDSSTEAGWALGAGVEFALGGNWTAKGEYMYVDLGSMSCSAGACGGAGPTEVDFNAHLLRAGLNLRF